MIEKNEVMAFIAGTNNANFLRVLLQVAQARQADLRAAQASEARQTLMPHVLVANDGLAR
jgi:hypothetical protein